MNATELRTLLIARRSQWQRRLEENRKALEEAIGAMNVDQAHLAEIEFALDQLDDLHKVPAAPVAEAPKPKPEKTPRDRVAELIAGRLGNDLPDNIDDLPAIFHEQYTPRTLRAALNIALQRRQKSSAGDESSSPPKEVQAIPPVVDNSGAGAVQGETTLEMPGFLRRSPSQAAAE